LLVHPWQVFALLKLYLLISLLWFYALFC